MWTDMYSLSPIYRLPNELVQAIVDYTDRETILAARLVSKTLCTKVEKAFGESVISERRHVLTRHSLETLLDISAHPHLGRYVRTVKLGSAQLSILYPRTPRAAIGRYIDISDEALKVLYYGLYHEQQDFARHDAVSLLQQVFHNLRKHQHELTLGVWDNIIKHMGSYVVSGFGSARFFSPILSELHYATKPMDHLEQLIVAALQEDCKIGTLDITSHGHSDGMIAWRQQWNTPGFKDMLSNLRVLKLTYLATEDDPNHWVGRDNCRYLLERTKALQVLDLTVKVPTGDRRVQWPSMALAECCTSQLRQLTLRSTSIRHDYLIPFLRNQTRCLARLDLTDAQFERGAPDLCNFLLEEMALDTLTMPWPGEYGRALRGPKIRRFLELFLNLHRDPTGRMYWEVINDDTLSQPVVLGVAV